MATVNCPECDEEISVDASKCPHCGERQLGLGEVVLGSAVMLIGGAIMGLLIYLAGVAFADLSPMVALLGTLVIVGVICLGYIYKMWTNYSTRRDQLRNADPS